jgi:hypothetical protein
MSNSEKQNKKSKSHSRPSKFKNSLTLKIEKIIERGEVL